MKLVYTIEYQNDLSSLKKEAKEAKNTVDKAFQGAGGSARKSTRAISEQEQALKELRKELRRRVILADVLHRKGEISQEDALERIKLIEQEMRAQGALNEKFLIGAQNQKSLHLGQKRIETGFQGMAATTNRANQVLFDLNQGLQDIPFGMRGIGNNIPFVIQGFRQFAEAAREQGISPLKAFMSALSSPAGLIGTAAAVIPTLILLAQQFDLFGGEAKEASDRVKELREELGRFPELLSSIASELSSRDFFGGEDPFNIQSLEFQEEFLKRRIFIIKNTIQELSGITEEERKRLKELRNLRDLSGVDLSAEQLTELQNLAKKEKQRKANIAVIKDEEIALEERKNQLKEIQKELADQRRIQREVNQRTRVYLNTSEVAFGGAVNGLRQINRELTNQIGLQDIASEKKRLQESVESRATQFSLIADISFQTALAEAEGFERRKLQLTRERILTESKLISAGVSRANAKKLAEAQFHAKMERLKTEQSKKQAQRRQQLVSQANQAILGGASNLVSALMQLNQAKDAQNEQQAREKFRRQKSLSRTSAIVQGLSAVVSAFNPYIPILSEARAAIITGVTAAQVAAINRQKFDSSSFSGGGSAGGGASSHQPPGTPESGFTTTTAPRVDSPTNFATNAEKQPVEIHLHGDLDDKMISIRAENGRKKRESRAVTINRQ